MKEYYNINDFVESTPEPTKHVKTTVSLFTFLLKMVVFFFFAIVITNIC